MKKKNHDSLERESGKLQLHDLLSEKSPKFCKHPQLCHHFKVYDRHEKERAQFGVVIGGEGEVFGGGGVRIGVGVVWLGVGGW